MSNVTARASSSYGRCEWTWSYLDNVKTYIQRLETNKQVDPSPTYLSYPWWYYIFINCCASSWKTNIRHQHQLTTRNVDQTTGTNKDQTLWEHLRGEGGTCLLLCSRQNSSISPKQIYDSFGGTGLIYPHNLLAVHTRIHFFQSCTNNNYQITMEVSRVERVERDVL